MLGERWTLLILRELIGGPRRYGDLRAQLPGIATNLLADRLRELEEAGLVDREELPPPIARTVYTLSETGWRKVLPVVKAIATFGLDMVVPDDSALTPLNGFLAGILLAFDPAHRRRPGCLVPHRDRRPPLRVRRRSRRAHRRAGPPRRDGDRDGSGPDQPRGWARRPPNARPRCGG